MNPKYISILLCSFIAGVACGSLYILPAENFILIILVGCFLATMVLVVNKNFGIILMCLVMGMSFGWWYVEKSFVPNEYENLV
ncbi:MAG TPA: hypothetical protein VHQ20_00100, partial [Patescibacteria group bacterium]|nr:hypothetical protein [Patescibacteria group bacterium]